jgi:hypothetical protein
MVGGRGGLVGGAGRDSGPDAPPDIKFPARIEGGLEESAPGTEWGVRT